MASRWGFPVDTLEMGDVGPGETYTDEDFANISATKASAINDELSIEARKPASANVSRQWVILIVALAVAATAGIVVGIMLAVQPAGDSAKTASSVEDDAAVSQSTSTLARLTLQNVGPDDVDHAKFQKAIANAINITDIGEDDVAVVRITSGSAVVLFSIISPDDEVAKAAFDAFVAALGNGAVEHEIQTTGDLPSSILKDSSPTVVIVMTCESCSFDTDQTGSTSAVPGGATATTTTVGDGPATTAATSRLTSTTATTSSARPSPSTTLVDATTIDDITFRQKLVPDDNAEGDSFGCSLAVFDGILVVGAKNANGRRGAAYVYTTTPEGPMRLVRKLLPDDNGPADYFGISVGVRSNIIAVGASGTNLQQGAVYVYYIDTDTRDSVSLIEKVVPDQGALDDQFGRRVAVGWRRVVVGAPYSDDNGVRSGAVYVYSVAEQYDSVSLAHRVTPGDGSMTDEFGWSVAISGDYLVVGAYQDDADTVADDDRGSAYIYRDPLDDSPLELIEKLMPSDLDDDADFGWSVALKNQIALVGAPRNNNGQGAVYVRGFGFRPRPELQKIVPENVEAGDDGDSAFGESVGNDGEYIAIGDYLYMHRSTRTGAVDIFQKPDGFDAYIFRKRLVPADAAPYGRFGVSVDLEDSGIYVGASCDDDNGFCSGAVYVYSL